MAVIRIKVTVEAPIEGNATTIRSVGLYEQCFDADGMADQDAFLRRLICAANNIKEKDANNYPADTFARLGPTTEG